MTRALTFLLLTSAAALADMNYTDAMFRRAMAKDNLAVSGVMSDAPLFVLVRLRDPKSGATQEVCTSSSFLEGAIEMDHHFGYDTAGLRRIYEFAVSTPNRVFTFTSRKARANIAPHYTSQQLAYVRRQLGQKSRSQLKREVGRDGSEITRISEQPFEPAKHPWVDWQTVVAHVLLERGILVGLTHWGPSLYLDK